MSTAPDDAWRDAGLESPDDTTSLVEDALMDDAPEADDAAAAGGRAEEYRPRHARPDLDGEAAEADVVEQSQEVPGLDDPEASGDA